MPRDGDVDYLFKFVIVGKSSVGKSSVMMRFADDVFSESYVNTIGVDFKFKTQNIDEQKVKFQIWDTAGQERFRTITNAYYKNAQAIQIVFDLTSQSSFKEVQEYWLDQIKSHADIGVNLFQQGNKSDAENNREVSTKEAEQFAKSMNMSYFEVSAKIGENVNFAFESIAKQLIEVKKKSRKGRKNQDLGSSNCDMDIGLQQYINEIESEDEDTFDKICANTKKKTNEMVSDCC